MTETPETQSAAGGMHEMDAETFVDLYWSTFVKATLNPGDTAYADPSAKILRALFDRLGVKSIVYRGVDPETVGATKSGAQKQEVKSFVELVDRLRYRRPFVLAGRKEYVLDLNSQLLRVGDIAFLLEQLLDDAAMGRVLEMDLSFNSAFTTELAEALGRFLRDPSCGLRRLQLCHCELDDALLAPILSGLKENKTLVTLDVCYNRLTDAIRPALEELAREHPALLHVKLYEVRMGIQETDAISFSTHRAVESAVQAKLEARRLARGSSGVESGR